MSEESLAYEWKPVKGLVLSRMFWGRVKVLIGLFISIKLWKTESNIEPFFTYGRLRAVNLKRTGYLLSCFYSLLEIFDIILQNTHLECLFYSGRGSYGRISL